ncbi:MAG: hypothetical protein BWY12_00111 [candidate division BRC1 bacterium ADurb.Bin183]|nr:MAG: hypothetical protein BWY12_00111 [candidate division BRC1 bacterium ADurb.Bin183]
MFCSKCGTQNEDNNYRCINCGQILHSDPQPAITQRADYTIGGLIPYKNPYALIAYFLGFFSIIPFLGLPLGIGACVLGLEGFKFAKEHPEAKGERHAKVGVLLGGFFGFLNIVLVIIFKHCISNYYIKILP